jgi:hypothetical protein
VPSRAASDVTIWNLLEHCVWQLDEPFRRSEIIGWFRRHHPEVLESSLAAHIQGATAGAPGRGPFASRKPLLVRVDRGLYRRAEHLKQPTVAASPYHERVEPPVVDAERELAAVLVGCVKSKRAVPSRVADLYTSPLFRRRRAYAESRGLPWFVISAEHGLLHPDDIVAPYDRALADQTTEYRSAWGAWVVAKLEDALGTLGGCSLEIHAGSAYVDALQDPLRRRGCDFNAPLRHLRQGEQLAWYGDGRPQMKPADNEQVQPVEALVARLSNSDEAVTPKQLLHDRNAALDSPGLYSWWVDADGARDLSLGLGHHVSPGLIYAGQAGSTRWPSGRRSRNTLRDRLIGMHLTGNVEFSTFRRTLWAVLDIPLGLAAKGEHALTEWMTAHLRVIAVPVPDADVLGRIEGEVLEELNPPLNLAGRPPSDIRETLRGLRSAAFRRPPSP